MSVPALRYICVSIGVLSLMIWFIRAVFTGTQHRTGQCESLIHVRDRKRVTDKAELVAISFQNQMHLLSVSGEHIRLLVSCCDRLHSALDSEIDAEIKETR